MRKVPLGVGLSVVAAAVVGCGSETASPDAAARNLAVLRDLDAWHYQAQRDPMDTTIVHTIRKRVVFGNTPAAISFTCNKGRLSVLVTAEAPVRESLTYKIGDGPSRTITGQRAIVRSGFAIGGNAARALFQELQAASGMMTLSIAGERTETPQTIELDSFKAKAGPVAAACKVG